MNTLKHLLRRDEGVTAVEYGLIAALIAVALIAVITGLGLQIKATFEAIDNAM